MATVRVVGGELRVEPELAAEGTAEIVVVATDAAALTATVRFEVRWSSSPPRAPTPAGAAP